MFDPVVVVSLLNYHILFIHLIRVHLLLLFPLFTIFMSLHPIEKLFMIHFAKMLWLRKLLVSVIHGIKFHCHHENVLLDLVRYTKSYGSIDRYKTRLVAKGYTQYYVMDYEKTFVVVEKITTVLTLIVVTFIFQWEIFQMGVKNAFLNGDVHVKVYIIPSPGVSHKSSEVCKLQKALYGLKITPRDWFQKFSIIIVSLDFVASHHDSTLIVRKTNA